MAPVSLRFSQRDSVPRPRYGFVAKVKSQQCCDPQGRSGYRSIPGPERSLERATDSRSRGISRVTVDFTPSARVIADSVSPQGNRLTTLEVKLHRFVLSELNTHRAFSRNSASSRAIPVTRSLTMIAEEPAVPLRWPSAQKGMQGGPEIAATATARDIWLSARDDAVCAAERLLDLGVHKSVVNRLLEPYLPHTVVISATDWDGFWDQRCSPLAQPEIRAAAEAMRDAYVTSRPAEVGDGEWHLPYIRDSERRLDDHIVRRVSAARCARTSYLTHDGRRDLDADLNLFDRLLEADPPHASPLEHPATPGDGPGNFTGWKQLRHIVLGQ